MQKWIVAGLVLALAVGVLLGARGPEPTGASSLTPVVYMPIVVKAQPTSTATATATATLAPSPTPTVTPTPAIARVVEPQATWNPASITVVSGAHWAATRVKLLDPCENHNMGIGFLTALDQSGNFLDNVIIKWQNGPYVFDAVTGAKGPGKAEVVMLGEGNYSMWVDRDERGAVTSDRATNMETYQTAWNLPDYYRVCAETGEEGNAPKHLGYSVTFRRVR